MKQFDEGITKVIETLQTPSYAVLRGPKICSCVDYATKEADAHCKRCLGTGRNVTIKNILLAIRTAEGSFQNMAVNEKAVVHQGYVLERYSKLLNVDDLIVEGDAVYRVIKKSDKRSDQITPVYSVVYLADKKDNKQVFLKMFNEVMK